MSSSEAKPPEVAIGDRVVAVSDGRAGAVAELLDGVAVVHGDPVVMAGEKFLSNIENLMRVEEPDRVDRPDADQRLDRIARLLNKDPGYRESDLYEEIAAELAESGREMLDACLSDNRNSEMFDFEHYEANAQAAYLLGRTIRDGDGRTWKVTGWDPLGKDGWATIGDGTHWTRPEQVEVVDGDTDDQDWVDISGLSADETDRLVRALTPATPSLVDDAVGRVIAQASVVVESRQRGEEVDGAIEALGHTLDDHQAARKGRGSDG